MKFLAMLKDSLRETLDVKLFYVLVGLSLLVVLLVGSVTYRPVPMQQQIEFVNRLVNLGIHAQLASRPETRNLDLRLGVENFQQLGDRPEPWLADYRFQYVLTVRTHDQAGPAGEPDRQLLEKVKKDIEQQLSAKHLEREFEQTFTEVKVRELPGGPPEQIRYEVTTGKGTKFKSRKEWFHEPRLFFGLVPVPVPLFSLKDIIDFIGDKVVGSFGAAFTLLISIIFTASFLPSMLAKGTVDLLLVKPIRRPTLLLYKFLGGLLFMFLNTVLIMAGLWLGLGVQSGVWVNAFLLCIFVFTFQFAILYAVSALVAVLTRSAIVSILATLMTWAALILVGWTHWFFIEKPRPDAPASYTGHWAYVGYDLVHSALPRYKDLDWLTSKLIQEELIKPVPVAPPDPNDRTAVAAYEARQKRLDEVYEKQKKGLDKQYGAFHWGSSLAVSSLFIAVMLGLACWRFATRDY